MEFVDSKQCNELNRLEYLFQIIFHQQFTNSISVIELLMIGVPFVFHVTSAINS